MKVQVHMETKNLAIDTCLVQLKNGNQRRSIMKNISKLRELKKDKIYITDNLSRKDRGRYKKCIRKKAEQDITNGRRIKVGYKKAG